MLRLHVARTDDELAICAQEQLRAGDWSARDVRDLADCVWPTIQHEARSHKNEDLENVMAEAMLRLLTRLADSEKPMCLKMKHCKNLARRITTNLLVDCSRRYIIRARFEEECQRTEPRYSPLPKIDPEFVRVHYDRAMATLLPHEQELLDVFLGAVIDGSLDELKGTSKQKMKLILSKHCAAQGWNVEMAMQLCRLAMTKMNKHMKSAFVDD